MRDGLWQQREGTVKQEEGLAEIIKVVILYMLLYFRFFYAVLFISLWVAGWGEGKNFKFEYVWKNKKDTGFDLVSGDFLPINEGACKDWVIVCDILFVKD